MDEQLFWTMLQRLTGQCPKFGGPTHRGMPRRFKRAINVVDSSTIKLVANCIDWARHRRKKAAAKLHLRLNLQSFLPRFAIVDTAATSDASQAPAVCAGVGAGEIVIFDKAYVAFDHLWRLTGRGVFWVTRAKDNFRSRCVKRLLKKSAGQILRDDLVAPNGDKTRDKYPRVLRRVVALVEVDGQQTEMTLISNNLEWAASSVTELYKSRWAIEVFFKEFKQTLQLCDFLGHNKNAIRWQIWTALLLHLLLRFLAFVNDWRHSFKRLFCLLRATLWDGLRLRSLLESCGTAAGGLVVMPAAPQQAYLPGFGPR